MENFDYTISIGQLGEQLTLNQWDSKEAAAQRAVKNSPVESFLAEGPSGA